MKITRRRFLRTSLGAAALLTLPLEPSAVATACSPDDGAGPAELCGRTDPLPRPAGDPPFQSWWVKTYLPTKSWPTPEEVETPLGEVSEGRYFRVDGPQRGHRLLVWNPRRNEHHFIGAEAVGPVEDPFWADFSDDGRWIDVTLTPSQHLKAMQGDQEVFRDLITAGIQQRTRPGFYRILRRVYNETMDSRTVPDASTRYLLRNVLHTQYFAGDGSAIHYNWWATTWGYPGSQGCLGMRLAGSKFMWDWADIGTPLTIHY